MRHHNYWWNTPCGVTVINEDSWMDNGSLSLAWCVNDSWHCSIEVCSNYWSSRNIPLSDSRVSTITRRIVNDDECGLVVVWTFEEDGDCVWQEQTTPRENETNHWNHEMVAASVFASQGRWSCWGSARWRSFVCATHKLPDNSLTEDITITLFFSAPISIW